MILPAVAWSLARFEVADKTISFGEHWLTFVEQLLLEGESYPDFSWMTEALISNDCQLFSQSEILDSARLTLQVEFSSSAVQWMDAFGPRLQYACQRRAEIGDVRGDSDPEIGGGD